MSETPDTVTSNVPSDASARDPWFLQIDRRILYGFVVVALGVPLFFDWSLPPAPLQSAKLIFDQIETIRLEREEAQKRGERYDKVVLVVVDWGPHTRAELQPQTEAVVRHLMWRKIKFVIITLVTDGTGFTKSIPEKLAKEYGAEYGEDWVNLGYKSGTSILVEHLAKDFHGAAGKDENGKMLSEYEMTKRVKSAEDIRLLVEITGLVGFFNMWVQFFQTDRARPDFAHGCTAITIPEAYTYLESGQIVGLFEGIAGAAAYNELLEKARGPDDPPASKGARTHMTSQMFAHGLIFVLVLLGNIGLILRRRAGRAGGAP